MQRSVYGRFVRPLAGALALCFTAGLVLVAQPPAKTQTQKPRTAADERFHRHADAAGPAVARARPGAAASPCRTPGATPGAAPSDAVVLFDGRDCRSGRTTAPAPTATSCSTRSGQCGPDTSERHEAAPCTRAKVSATCSCTSNGPRRRGHGQQPGARQQRHFPDGAYEIQVLDSYNNRTYADGRPPRSTASGRRSPTPRARAASGKPMTSCSRRRASKAASW